MSILKDIKAAIYGKEQDYTQIKLRRAILILAIPMVLEMIFESLFALFDAAFVSRIGSVTTFKELILSFIRRGASIGEQVEGSSMGDIAASVVGTTESLMTIVYALGMGISIATSAIIARRIGENNVKKASVGASQSILLGIVISIFLAVPGVLFPNQIYDLLNAEQAVVDAGSRYLQLMLGGNVLIMILFINNAIFRSAGNPALSMRVMIFANLINIVLDPCFIFGLGPFPELGVTGAAVATNTGRGLAVLYQFYLLFKGKGRVKLLWEYFKPKFKILRKILVLSGGGIFQMLIATTSWVFLYSILGNYKSEVTAGYTFGIRLFIFFILPAWGLSGAVSTLVGQNLGAKQPKRAEKAVYFTGIATVAYMFLVMIAFQVIPELLLSLFQTSDKSLSIAISCMRIVSIGNIFYGFQMVIGQALNGAGDTYTPTWLNFIAFWIIELPVAWYLSHHTGLQEKGVFYSIPIAESILCILSFIVFRRGKWKLKQV